MRFALLGNGTDWLPYMLYDLNTINDSVLINSEFPIKGKFSTLAKKMLTHRDLSGPFRKLFFPKLAKEIRGRDDNHIVLIIFDWNRLGVDADFIMYIRKKIASIKLVYVFTNVVKISCAQKYGMVANLSSLYDKVYTFEEDDALQYGFSFSPLFHSRIPCKLGEVNNRVFFVGNAKDRYPMLVSIYKKLREHGINTLFYITAVPERDWLQTSDIVYNHPIPYSKTVELENCSSCLLEVLQSGAKGFTLNVRFAVCNNKLLITTNENIKNAPFYNPNFIQIIKNVDDIDPSFLANPERVQYTQKDRDYFSVKGFLNGVVKDLNI